MRFFAADPDKRTKIWRFGKTSGQPELKPIENVAVKFHLYSPRDENGERNDAFERRLSSLEQWFGLPTPLTTEGDEFLSVAGIAAHAQEAVLQPSTLQVVLELALNVAPASCGRPRPARRETAGNDAR